MQEFKPYSNEKDVIRIGGFEIENRLDRVAITGDLVLTKDQNGLALANDLRILAGRIVKILEKEKKLPKSIEEKAAKVVKNPFI
ncbi:MULTISPECIES: hypothetical protein [Giesbergeria]|uniref:Uncharacterized protein n=1 Tax=Giesbergeria sinuosa TaxID=80883 RepID=A0ABV9QK38_9BURK